MIVAGESQGATRREYATLKYTSSGVPLWTNRYNGPAGDSCARAVTVDTSGNVVVTGYYGVDGGYDCDYVTIKYSAEGVPLWTNRYTAGWDLASAVAVDSAGNVYVTGESLNNYTTIKYSSGGMPLWTNRYNGPENQQDTPRAIAVDGSGNVFVTGGTGGTGFGGEKGCTTVAYSTAGVPLWTNRYNASGSGMGIAVDSLGHVYVTGHSLSDFVTISYSNGGEPLWTNIYNGPASTDDGASALALDSSGNVFVCGDSVGNGSGYDFAIIKYSVVPAASPAIASHPLSRTNLTGTTATFSVSATGDAPLSYQWRKGGTNLLETGRISGVTTTNVIVSSVQWGDAGDYTVVVTNNVGSVTSSVAHMTVYSLGRFSNCSFSPVTGFSFVFRDATPGWSYRIQNSTSLAPDSWADWMSFNYSGPMAFMDMSAVQDTNKFYRAISP